MKRTLTRFGIFLIKAISRMPFGILYAFSDFLYFFIYHIVGYRKKVVRENLRFAFPEKTETELKQIEKDFYHHFADFMVESIKTYDMSREDLEKRWVIENADFLDSYYDKGKSISLLTMHYNNWEWSNYIAPYIKHYPLAIYRPLHNELFDEFMLNLRSKFGVVMQPDKNALRKIIEVHKSGQPQIIWLASDQAPPSSYKNWYEFLNRETIFFNGAAQISKKFNHAIFFQRIKKLKRGYYTVKFEVLIDDPTGMSDEEIMRVYIDRMEEIIRAEPAYYLWSHRRWKHKRKLLH